MFDCQMNGNSRASQSGQGRDAKSGKHRMIAHQMTGWLSAYGWWYGLYWNKEFSENHQFSGYVNFNRESYKRWSTYVYC